MIRSALAIAGPVAVAVTWWIVRRRGMSIWVANVALMTGVGLVAIAAGPEPTRGADPGAALGMGILAGAALYVATAAFMALAGRWPPLARQARALYGNRGSISLPAAVALSALIVAPGEELLWRGVVLEVLSDRFGSLAIAAAVTWIGYVVANAFSGSIPILLGAVVGGAAWTVLAITELGVMGAIGCHAVWTSLMILRPPVPGGTG